MHSSHDLDLSRSCDVIADATIPLALCYVIFDIVVTAPSINIFNKMPCYRKDDREMRPIAYYGCSENFWESLHSYA